MIAAVLKYISSNGYANEALERMLSVRWEQQNKISILNYAWKDRMETWRITGLQMNASPEFWKSETIQAEKHGLLS
ncbi:hypothetical protein BCON_0249g00040 [Botryotinia convoluta]|uniref:Uncharacterized protein n=1 Tax=Botryotinia convoluta TaxID=54673 RepID=A0A4Z1HGK1_9HELO|nr:hypothetical protein BCON_0249g00040 [Botryotinia convoluta]